ncbi:MULTISPECIES: hypothetical protein [Methanosarcina]|nr:MULTISPECIES: hypothetical protein [Methanosarcina]
MSKIVLFVPEQYSVDSRTVPNLFVDRILSGNNFIYGCRFRIETVIYGHF